MYKKNEIVAMAIVYEGHLPQGYSLDKRELAGEIIDYAHQSGLSSEIELSPHAAISTQRINESAYYAGSYKATDDLPTMLQDCISEVRENIIANGEIPGPMPMKLIQFKSSSSIASTVWVGVQIKQ